MHIPAASANAFIARVRRHRPLRVVGDSAPPPPHAWQTTLRWNGDRALWEARVRPGWVGHHEVETPPQPAVEAPEATRTRTGAEGSAPVLPWLTEEPWFPIASALWRGLGDGATAPIEGDEVPLYFQDLGVRPAAKVHQDGFDGLVLQTSGDQAAVDSRRLLMATELLLHMPRPRVELRADRDPAGRLDLAATIVPSHRRNPWLNLQRSYLAEAPATLPDLLDGATDPGEDVLHVATLYLLSPAGAAGARPDETWQPHVKHRLWWDLRHATRIRNRPLPPLRLSLDLNILAGGVAQPKVDAILEDLAQADQQAALFLSRVRTEGHFWTI